MNAPTKVEFPPVNRPDAVDLDLRKIQPRRKFEVCNDLLDDFDALEDFYQKNGYLFFRGVLDPGSVEEARDAMLKVARETFGLVDEDGNLTGNNIEAMQEENPAFAGISKRLVEHPANQEVLTKILGSKPSMVPIVQYRLYPPNAPLGTVHQDGFYSPGIHDYRPLWVPLVPMTPEMGGLAIAVGHNSSGFFHNVARGAPYAIPEDMIDPDSWATIDYQPGDLLVVHPYAPHCGTPNTSDRMRISFDTRVQSARNPSTFQAVVQSRTPESVTVKSSDENVGEITLKLDPETFVRTRNPGTREKFEDFCDAIQPGQDLVVVREKDRAVMLRKASRP